VLGYTGKQTHNWTDHVNRMDRRRTPKQILRDMHWAWSSGTKMASDRTRSRGHTHVWKKKKNNNKKKMDDDDDNDEDDDDDNDDDDDDNDDDDDDDDLIENFNLFSKKAP
jgi:hypothetical protein